ncbi:DUF3237 domain-containing protein [Sneathiella sp.]|uniref:DUF3237 domain-containing protein n=1 Tax=Sneathiella sp. TaxID=1964365 RepID=UPI00356B0CCE
MSQISLVHAFDMHLTVKAPVLNLGKTPNGNRLIAEVTGGTVAGPLLQGNIQPGGGDWLLLRSDEVMQLDVRLTIKANDGGLIYVTYRGLRHGPKEVMDKMAAGEAIDPNLYYFRVSPLFETAAASHDWLNRHLFIATGERNPAGPTYRVYQVL